MIKTCIQKKALVLCGFLILLSCMQLLSCSRATDSKRELISNALKEELRRHPQSTLMDIYKFFFQGAYGPGHLIDNPQSALNYLNDELQNSTEFDSVLWQEVGYQKDFYRINLILIREGEISTEDLLTAFVESANTAITPTLEMWKKEWRVILGIIEDMNLSMPGFARDKNTLEKSLINGEVVAHHSKIYLDTYHPHYRVVSEKYFRQLISLEKTEWMQWRGPERDGSVPDSARRIAWPVRPLRLWLREVGGGYAGPIVAGNRIWVHARKGGKEVVSSLSLSDGETVWSASYDAPFRQDSDARAHGQGPYSTPTVANGRLFTFSVNSVLSAWNAEDGDLLWRREYSEEFDPSHPFFGAAASPLVWRDLCFVHFGASGWDVPDGGAMVALSVSDGKEKWRWDGDGPALGASPVICMIKGHWQLVFKSEENIVGLDPQTGNELWQIPFKVPMDNTIVTPLIIGDRLVTSDFDIGFRAWRIQSSGESWIVRELWRHRAVSLFTSSPVLAAGQVVGFSHFRRGQIFALDPSNGEVLWRGEPRWGEHASLISWEDRLLVFRENGSLVVGEVSRDDFRTVRTYRLGGSRMWGHPAVVDNRIIIKDGSRLVVYQFGG
jgi:outer membrane protein assembly factor BamB